MAGETFTDRELLYAATARCRCGAGLAYPLDHDRAFKLRAWVCSAVLKGEVEGPASCQWGPYSGGKPDGEHDAFDWAFYKIREETSINNHGGHSTRPAGTVCKTIGTATCPKCNHKWMSDPYVACGANHHWFSGPCPSCGYAVGGSGSYSSDEGKPIETRYCNAVYAA
jgi:hypothetical protein